MFTWFVALHLVGLVMFVAAHGASMLIAFRIRGEQDRHVIAALLAVSLRGTQLLYVGLLLLGIGGLGAAATVDWLTTPWNLASYVVLVVVLSVMYAVASPYYMGLRAGLEGNDKTPRLDDEALAARLQTRRPELLAVVGGLGLAVLVLLMTIKPG